MRWVVRFFTTLYIVLCNARAHIMCISSQPLVPIQQLNVAVCLSFIEQFF